MKIAISIEHLEPRRGGGETYARNFGRMLLSQGHEVHVYSFTIDPAEKGFIHHPLRQPAFNLFRRHAFAMRAREELQKESFDIIHGFGKSVFMDIFRPGGGVHKAWMSHELRATDGALARLGVRLRQATSIDQRLVLRLEREQFGPGRKHAIIAVSNLVRQEILTHYGCEPERIHVVHNGANLARFTPDRMRALREPMRRRLGLEEGEVMLLFLGHNYKRKGLHALIRALPLLKGRGKFRLVVAGKGRRAPCDRLAGALGVSGLIQYAGTTDAPEEFYAAADIFCFPSYYDPCANVVLEALACGLPVITSTTNGSGEILTAGREGYVVEPDDAESMAARIGEFFPAERRREASRAARALAEARPIERNFREILAIYDCVLSQKRSSQPSPPINHQVSPG